MTSVLNEEMPEFVDRCFINPPSLRSTDTSEGFLGRGLMCFLYVIGVMLNSNCR